MNKIFCGLPLQFLVTHLIIVLVGLAYTLYLFSPRKTQRRENL